LKPVPSGLEGCMVAHPDKRKDTADRMIMNEHRFPGNTLYLLFRNG